MNPLFTPTRVGRYTLPNRLVMAPMTRSRADSAGVIDDLVTTYYTQRSSAGLIVTEGVFPSARGKGYVRTPGIETDAQMAGWKRCVDAVHAQGGLIFMQVMHCGRISHPSLLHGAVPVAPSAIKADGKAWTDSGPQDFVVPHALSPQEIAGVIEDYRLATRRALAVGFDGVELHGGAGYLPEQFLSSGSNQRTDDYGRSVEGRIRFVLETLAAMVAEAGGDRVGLKISPEMNFNSITDANPQETYTDLVDHIGDLGLAYLHVALFGATSVDYHGLFRPRFKGAYLVGGGLDQSTAEALIAEGRADGTVFGQAFLANPDLPERFRRGAPLNAANSATFYSPGPQGYTDYPALGV